MQIIHKWIGENLTQANISMITNYANQPTEFIQGIQVVLILQVTPKYKVCPILGNEEGGVLFLIT